MATTHTLNPHDAVSMASRRAPLATMPNAVNSPFRTTQSVAGKRTRAQLGENVYGQPPAKKLLLDANGEGGENIDPLKRTGATVISNEKLDEPFSTKRTSTAPPTAFERKLASVREKKPVQQPLQHQQQLQRADRSQTLKGDNLENVRQWQRHYRRQFPQFVFYFDSVLDDVRQKAIRQVRSLGAVSDCSSSLSVYQLIVCSVKKSSSPMP
jgi:regulatory subunit for Cdc7p protein kinase